MTRATAPLRRDVRSFLSKRGIDGFVAALGCQRGKVLRQVGQVVVLQVLDNRRHRLDLAHALAHQKKLVEDEERRLAGERWNLLDLGVAVVAVAGAAKLNLFG